MNIPLILSIDYSDRTWIMDGEDYSGLEWLDESPKPTEEELQSKWLDVQYRTQYAAVQEVRLRAYQRDADPLFFGFQRGDNTEQEWLDAVQAVKDANPYPEAPIA